MGVYLSGNLAATGDASDLMLRKIKVAGKFVKLYGPGSRALSVPDRATIANMVPEYGATMVFIGASSRLICWSRPLTGLPANTGMHL